MATKIIFQSSSMSGIEAELECFANTNEEICIVIDAKDLPVSYICLDKETAIKLSKVLKSEISKI